MGCASKDIRDNPMCNMKVSWLIIRRPLITLLCLSSLMSFNDATAAEAPEPQPGSGPSWPILTPSSVEGHHVVAAGEPWELQCEGFGHRIFWTHPAGSSTESRMEISMDSDRGGTLRSSLHLAQTVYTDTGYYTCHQTDEEGLRTEAKTYLYVADPLHFFAESRSSVFLNVPELHETVVPCRVTDPGLKLRFFKGILDITDDLASRNLRFDPRRGLIITSGSPEHHRGLIVCKASDGSSKKPQEFKAMLNFQHIPEYLHSPLIDGPATSQLVAGNTVTLTCEAVVEKNTVHVELRWARSFGPEDVGTTTGEHSWWDQDLRTGRLVIGEQRREGIEDKVKILRTLTFRNLSAASDAGSYDCWTEFETPADLQRSEKQTHTLVHIRGSADEPYIGEVKFQGHHKIELKGSTKSVKWVLGVFAAPSPTYTWIDPSGKKIDHRQQERYDLEVIDPEEGVLKLVIYDVSFEDMGEYLLKVQVGDPAAGSTLEKVIPLVLIYQKKPTSKLIGEVEGRRQSGHFHLANQGQEVSCVLQGYPINVANLRWTFVPCEDQETAAQCSRGPEDPDRLAMDIKPTSIRQQDGLINTNYSFKIEASYNFVAKQSGVFVCEICAGSERESRDSAPAGGTSAPAGRCHRSTMSFFVSEFVDGFELKQPESGNTAVEGEGLEVTCGASKYLYQMVQWYKEVPPSLPTKGLLPSPARPSESLAPLQQDAKRCRTIIDDEDLVAGSSSLVSKLCFQRLRFSDSGSYECHAWPINGTDDGVVGTGAEVKKFHLKVLKAVAPTLLPRSNMNTSTTSHEEASASPYIEAKLSQSLILDCSAGGFPTPDVVWRKNGHILEMSPDDQGGGGPESSTGANDTSTASLQRTGGGNSTLMKVTRESVRFLAVIPEHQGQYSCTVSNVAGNFTVAKELRVMTTSDQSLPLELVGAVCAVLVLFLGIVALLVFKICTYNRKLRELLTDTELKLFEEGDPVSINPQLGLDEQADLLPYNKTFEFPRSQLRMLENQQLGSGAFGRVMKAKATGIVQKGVTITVAVKMVKRDADVTYVKALMSELKIMMHLGKHINIVNLLGACTEDLKAKRELLVIVEYCRYGNLQRFLMTRRSSFVSLLNSTTNEIEPPCWAFEEDVVADDGVVGREQHRVVPDQLVEHPANNAGGGNHWKPKNASNCNNYAANESLYNAGISMNTEETTMMTTATSPTTTLRFDRNTTTDDDNDGVSTRFRRSTSKVSSKSNNHEFSGRSRGGTGSSSAETGGEAPIVISTKDLLSWAFQVARGMEYLAAKRVLHGDLACRNVLLAANNVVKICDFGLAKDMYGTETYWKKSDGPLPLKWMAIESLRDRVFSTQSDVWSFGIVLWEMFSLGKMPYPGIHNEDFFHRLISGYRMERPAFCPASIYEGVMLKCWNVDPDVRPSFSLLAEVFRDCLYDGEHENYLVLEAKFEENMQQRARRNFAVTNPDYIQMMSPPEFKQKFRPVDHGHEDDDDDDVETGQDGYLLPKPSLATSSPAAEASSSKRDPESAAGAILIDGNPEVDETGYLVSTSQGQEDRQQLGINDISFDSKLRSQQQRIGPTTKPTTTSYFPISMAKSGTYGEGFSCAQHQEPVTRPSRSRGLEC